MLDRPTQRFYAGLIEDRSWVLRRIETVNLLDERRFERRITFDIDLAELRRRARATGFSPGHGWLLPLAILRKQVQLDLDLTDESGTVLPVATSDKDARIAAAYVLGTGSTNRRAARTIANDLFDVMRHANGSDVLLEILDDVLASGLIPAERTARRDAWATLLDNTAFSDALALLSNNYLFIAILPVSDERDVRVVKFRYTDEASQRLRIRERLGLDPLQVRIEAPGVGTALREHLRVTVPDGMHLSSFELETRDGSAPKDDYEVRLATERAVIYTAGAARSEYFARAQFVVRAGVFAVQALLISLFTSVLLGFGVYFEAVDHRFSDQTAGSNAIAIVLAVAPALLALYIAQSGEHRAVSGLLRAPRLLLAISAFATLLVGAALAARVEPVTVSVLMAFALVVALLNAGLDFLAAFAAAQVSRSRR